MLYCTVQYCNCEDTVYCSFVLLVFDISCNKVRALTTVPSNITTFGLQTNNRSKITSNLLLTTKL